MRTPLALVLLTALAGCPTSTGGECNSDPDCGGGDVCARDKMCTSASSVRAVTTTWTINGAEANVTSCASKPDLFITFIGRDASDTIGFTPVPCRIGQFLVDKLPDRFREVELGVEGGASLIRAIGSSNTVAIDLR
ncbi:MAG: hypothetical protein H0T42_34290 [Deltaproteobacteria bacterium]|nr:hypothetical protein [Deltaproteobacteria bacterium]